MKKFLSILILLVSMQMVSATAAQALEVQDEITTCMDIDIGDSLTVEIVSLHSTTQTAQSYGMAICNRDIGFITSWRYQDNSYNIEEVPKRNNYNKQLALDVINGSSGGVSARTQSLT